MGDLYVRLKTMRAFLSAISAIIPLLFLVGCDENHELTSMPVDPDGDSVGEVYVELQVPEEGAIFSSSSGCSDRWLVGKQVTGGSFPDPYIRNWWFDLIRRDGANEGCVQIAWDPEGRRGFALCRSWRNVDLRFVTSDGEIFRFEHRPTHLRPVDTWTFVADVTPKAKPIKSQ